MLKRMRLVGAGAVVGLLAIVGCSSDEDDEDPFDPNATATTGSGTSSGTTTGSSGSGTGGANSGSSANASGTTDDGSSSSSVTSVTSGSSTTGASTTSATGTTGTTPSVDACAGFEVDTEQDACVGTGYEAEPVDVDMYIMVDFTSSMDNSDEVNGLSRWELTVQAIKDFVNSPGAADIRVALQFFSYVQESDCNVSNYSSPEVDMGFAPDVAGDIEDALDAKTPIGLTPTYPALSGAIDFAKDWQQGEGLGRQTVVVFVTDGYPTECDPLDVSAVADLAANSFQDDPRVPVYVIGIDGVLNLNQIAQAGGTREAFDIQSGGTTDDFVAALSNITNSEVTCEFEIPAPPDNMSVNYEEVQVIYDPANGDPMEVPFSATGYAGCNTSENGGWYFGGSDGNGGYTKILTCPCTCASFQAGAVEVRLGCSPTPTIM